MGRLPRMAEVLIAMAGSLDAVAGRLKRDAAQPLAVLLMAFAPSRKP
jgi:hypothetical protein